MADEDGNEWKDMGHLYLYMNYTGLTDWENWVAWIPKGRDCGVPRAGDSATSWYGCINHEIDEVCGQKYGHCREGIERMHVCRDGTRFLVSNRSMTAKSVADATTTQT